MEVKQSTGGDEERSFDLLPRIRHLIVLAHPDFRFLLGTNMLHKRLTSVLRLVLANPAGIPELARNTQVLAAADEGVGATAFRSGGNALRGEIILFAAGDRNQSITSQSYQPLASYFPHMIDLSAPASRQQTRKPGEDEKTYRPLQTSAYSLVTTFGVTILSLLGTSPHPPGPNARFRIRRYLISGT